MIQDFKKGDRVLLRQDPERPRNPGPGTVVKVSESRVTVTWDRAPESKAPYLPDNLIRLEPAE